MGELENEQALEGTQDTGSESSEGEAQGAEPKTLTRKEIVALIETGTKKAVSLSQSLVDKADHRISGRLTSELKSLETYMADLKAAGHEVPSEVIERVKQDVVLRSLTGEPAGAEEKPSLGADGKPVPKGEASEPDSADATGMVALAMMEEAGIFIEEEDPEFKLIDMKTSSKRVFLDSVGKSIDTKKERLTGSSEEGPESDEDLEDAETRRRARTPTAAERKRASKAVQDGLTPMEYLKRGYSKK